MVKAPTAEAFDRALANRYIYVDFGCDPSNRWLDDAAGDDIQPNRLKRSNQTFSATDFAVPENVCLNRRLLTSVTR